MIYSNILYFAVPVALTQSVKPRRWGADAKLLYLGFPQQLSGVVVVLRRVFKFGASYKAVGVQRSRLVLFPETPDERQ